MPRRLSGPVRRSLAGLGLALFASCSRDTDGERLAPEAPSPDLSLSVSSAGAAPGASVAVVLRTAARDGGSIAGLQGSLRFDPERLEYLGQSPVGSSVVVTNWSATDRGTLRILAIDTLLRRLDPSVFAFRVKAAGYTEGLRFQVEGAVAPRGRPLAGLEPPLGVGEDPSLSLGAEPRRLTVEDWAERLGHPRAAVRLALVPGQGTRYGDATLDGPVNILDALATANVAVGNLPLLTDAGKDFAIAANVFPANLPGLGEVGDAVPPGREPDGSFLINVLDVAVITNESIGNDPPIAGDPIPGRTVPAARATLAGAIAADRTLSRDTVYELDGLVTVPNFVTLTVQAGTRLEGRTATRGALAIQLGGRIQARGTRLQPIIMTCTAAVKTPGCWGGLTIAGPALLNNGDAGSGNEIQCPEKPAVDGSGVYGGCLVEFSSGTLRYARVEYAGMAPASGPPVAGLQLLGVGNGTAIDSVQVHRGLGAGVFVSGGRATLRAAVLTGNEGGGLAWDDGWLGKVQALIVQRGVGDGPALRGSNAPGIPDAGPRSMPLLANITITGPGGAGAAVRFANGTGAVLSNSIVSGSADAGLDIDDAATCGLPAGTLVLRHTIFFANTPDFDGDADCVDEAAFAGAAGLGNLSLDPGLIGPALTLTPDFRPLSGSAAATLDQPPIQDPYFDSTQRWAGAVPPANPAKGNIPWYAGWTVGW